MSGLRANATPYVPLVIRQRNENAEEMNRLLREINTRRRRNLDPLKNQNEMTNLLREINNTRERNLQQGRGRTRKQRRRHSRTRSRKLRST